MKTTLFVIITMFLLNPINMKSAFSSPGKLVDAAQEHIRGKYMKLANAEAPQEVLDHKAMLRAREDAKKAELIKREKDRMAKRRIDNFLERIETRY